MVMTQDEIRVWLKEFWVHGAFVRLPDHRVQLWKGPWQKSEAQSDLERSTFSICFMPFFGSNINAMNSAQSVEVSASNLLSVLDRILEETLASGSDIKSTDLQLVRQEDFSTPRKDDFERSLQIIQGKIHRSEIEKAVPVVVSRNEKRPSKFDLIVWLRNVLNMTSTVYPFGFWDEQAGILGATPEVLFRMENGHIASMALAGTCPKSEMSIRPSLMKDPKENLEHDLVVDDVVHQLSKFGFVRKGPKRILELPTLLHLATDLTVESQVKNPLAIIKALHPTPALGVAPRAYGIQWMKTLPHQDDRQLHGAPICFCLSESHFLCLVAIRAIQWGSYGSQIVAGCGIVASSELEREWQEIQQKTKSVFLLLGL